MIVSTIKQFGLRLRTDPEEIPFQYSANVQMKFEKDENYNDYTVVGYYIPPGQHEAKLLSINDDGTFILGPDCFKQRGTLSFSFNLINSQEEVHLGSIDFEVRYSFGDGDTILPEPEEVWIRLVAQVAKDAIKEEVALVKQKANEALQSASLANDKASEAKEYANNANQSANSANLSASSALTAKNDAIAASNSAIQAKQDAEQSANNAKNSANTALENANKSTEAIETVTQIKIEIENKANDFDTNYQEKLNAFNDNATEKQSTFNQNVTSANTNFDNKVTQANSDLDAKVQEANTIIDEKVKTATEQAQKAKEEANRAEQATDGKLDKNLGVENAGKSLVVGENGEVVCGESGINEDEVNKIIDKAIDEKLYTQEEVDYMLSDKMDKPYVSIEITDSATITDALEGNFKIDMIKGNTYQNVEENIVPTPDRPVPINSRKVLANGEYVELRSLKETGNLFDLKYGQLLFGEKVGSTTNNGSGVIIENQYAITVNLAVVYLKANTNYCFKSNRAKEPIEGMEESGNDLNMLGVLKGSTPIIQVISGNTFTVNDSGYYYLRLYGTVGCKVSYTSIMLVEGTSAPSTYIPPTIRDYKIVDHVNKTAKIVRNVGLYVDDKTGDSWTTYDNQTFQNSYFKNIKDMKRSNRILSYSNSFEVVNENTGVGNANSMWIGVTNSNVFVIRTDFKTIEEWKTWLKNNDLEFLYPLVTPVEESIAYVETDVSEVGYSWQDTTSPSPTIKSEVKPVEKIDILKTGKNLLNEALLKNADGYDKTLNPQGFWEYILYLKPNTKYTISRENTIGYQLGYHIRVGTIRNNFNSSTWFVASHANNENKQATTITTNEDGIVVLYFNNTIELIKKCLEIIGYLQIEQGETATPYEPYMGQHINIALPQPMYGTSDGKISDIANIENKQYEYYLKKVVFDGTNAIFTYLSNSNNVFYTSLDDAISPYEIDTKYILCENLTVYPANFTTDNFVDNSIKYGNGSGTSKLLFIKINDTIKTADMLYMWLKEHPITVYYVTPTTLPIPEEDLKLLKSLKTEQGVTNIFVGGEIKPSIEARYPQDVVSAVNTLQTRLLTLQEEVIKNV